MPAREANKVKGGNIDPETGKTDPEANYEAIENSQAAPGGETWIDNTGKSGNKVAGGRRPGGKLPPKQ